ncbi:MAG: hypothetical protein Q8J74_00315, partial [Candidatus Didemnitutus sp.]|nr:hypothetical protein [Candidatus Didemnitutus sp.]
MAESCNLHVVHDWDAAWRDLVRPWLADRTTLQRDHVLVPTRGQAHALKLRCVREGVALLGVEFLTPGLAWPKLANLTESREPALGRELLRLNLRALIAERLAPLPSTDPAWGLWKSLQSDPERALADFDQLLQAGFTASDFPLRALRDVFGELAERVDAFGYVLAPVKNISTALLAVQPGASRLGGRLLIYGFTAENWPEFFPLAALARRAEAVTVILPEPELRGRRAHDEHWIEVWASLLGVEAVIAPPREIEPAGAAVARVWREPVAGTLTAARVIVGQTRTDEMELVADEVARLLGRGATNVAVVFPRSDPAHLRLLRLLTARGLPFNDLLDTAAPPVVDAQLQNALLRFYERGARIEELLVLWPLLRALNHTTLDLGRARAVCERVFDELQTHALAAVNARLAASTHEDGKEVARLVALLLPAWPNELTLGTALGFFAEVGSKFHLELPESWQPLRVYADRDQRVLPAKVIFATLAEFLVEKSAAADPPGRGLFAPVTLTSRQRAAALAWSDIILVESNAGIWPQRTESSCWLTDEQRTKLNQRGRFSLGVPTSEDRADLEKKSYASIAANTSGEVVFAAALFDEEEPELKCAPNAWLERVLFAVRGTETQGRSLEEDFSHRARTVAGDAPPGDCSGWFATWQSRRDRALPFDDYFFCGDPVITRPAQLAAGLIERGMRDPVELWFGAVLKTRRVEWAPLVRARKKSLGQIAHRLLADALRGDPARGDFMQIPPAPSAREQLARALQELRVRWPRDRYWDSFHAELAEMGSVLLEKVFSLAAPPFVATELRLPAGTTIALGPGGARLGIAGRMDLVLSDRPEWRGAT